MWKFFKIFFVIFVFIISIWSLGRSFLPEKYRETILAQTLDDSIGIIYANIISIVEEIKPNNTADQIIEITVSQISALIHAQTKYKKPILLYIYSLNCELCKMNFDDINEIVADYDELLFLIIGIENNKEVLAKFLNGAGKIHFKPLMIPKSESGQLLVELKKLGSSYNQPSHIDLISKDGYFTRIKIGLMNGAKIRAKIDKFIKK